jgi:hypothetical protein
MTLDESKVYANDDDASPAFWTVLPGGTDGKINAALLADPMTGKLIAAKFADPNNVTKRANVVDHINRITALCIAQVITGKHIAPEQAGPSIYNLLSANTALDVDAVINAAANLALHNAFASGSPPNVIEVISRQTGRALFQECLSQLLAAEADPFALLSTVETELRKILPTLPVGL